MGKADAAALEHIAFLDQPRNAAAALRALPGIPDEGLAVNAFQRRDDAVLQAEQIGFNVGRGGGNRVHGMRAKRYECGLYLVGGHGIGIGGTGQAGRPPLERILANPGVGAHEAFRRLSFLPARPFAQA
jgi:hypothetical protein